MSKSTSETTTTALISMYFDIPNHDVILGKKCLKAINPNIDWRNNEIKFKHQGKEITLCPQQLPKIESITALQAKRLFRKSQIYLCIFRNISESTRNRISTLDPRIQRLVNEYIDVFQDLPGLPSARKVDHRIELCAWSTACEERDLPAFWTLIRSPTTRIKEIEEIRAYPRQYIAMGNTHPIRQEARRFSSNVHLLPSSQCPHHKEQISHPAN